MKNNLWLAASFLILAVVVVGVLVAKDLQDHPKALLACGFRDDKTITIGSQQLKAEVVTSPQAQAKGLSGRQCIAANEAMLFEFPKPGQYSFWMKDMKFPIDMIWVAANHKVVSIKENVQPSTYPDSFTNAADQLAQYILEVQAHDSSRLRIDPGTTINF